MAKVRRIPFLWVGLALLVGLLLGWLVVGWWLWPAKCAEANAQEFNLEQQKKFVEMVADDYERSNDLSRARELLAGFDEGMLANLLGMMQGQALNPELAQLLGGLAEGLNLPGPEDTSVAPPDPLLNSLLGQKAVAWSLVLPGAMLVVAIVLTISPHFRKVGSGQIARRQMGAREVQEPWTPQEAQGEGLWAPQKAEGEGRAIEVIMQTQQVAAEQAQTPEVQAPQAQKPQAETPQGKQEEAKAPPTKTASLPGGSDATVQNIVASVFSEEIIDPYLEALSKSLGDVNILNLSKECKEVADRLHRPIWGMDRGEPSDDASIRSDGAGGGELSPLGGRLAAAFQPQQQASGA